MRLVWEVKPAKTGDLHAGVDIQSEAAEKNSLKTYLQALKDQGLKAQENSQLERDLNILDTSWNRPNYDREHDPQKLVEKIRLGTTTKDSPYLARFVRLSNQFLRVQEPPEGLASFIVDFSRNALAEKRVGAADMLPDNAYKVAITKGNETIIATRAFNPSTHRIGYYNDAKLHPQSGSPIFDYVPVHTGYKIVILEEKELSPQEIEDQTRKVYDEGSMQESSTESAEKEYQDDRSLAEKPRSPQEVYGKTQTQLAALSRELTLGMLGRKPTGGTAQPTQNPSSALGFMDRTTMPQDASKPSHYVSTPDQLPQDNSPGLLRSREAIEQTSRLVGIAKNYADASRNGKNMFREDFANVTDLRGGKVGCAWVANRILRDAGYLETDGVKAVVTVENELRHKGWSEIPEGEHQPGDVVIWEKLPPTVLPSGGTRPGHEHIGIVTGADMAVDNDGVSLNGPIERPLTRYYVDPKTSEKVLRKVKCFLRAPSSNSSSNAREVDNKTTVDDVIRSEAARLNIDPGFAKAIIRVEAKNGINENGQVTIRFEPHVFNKFLGIQGKSDTAGSWGADKINGRSVAGISCQGGQGGEYGCFRKALEINPDAAFKAISMGAGQIMGFNAKSLGYKSAEDMYQHFSLQGGGEAEQTAAMFKFIENNPALLNAAQQSDYVKFAQIYNGAPVGTAKNTQYAQDLKRYHIGGSNNGTATA